MTKDRPALQPQDTELTRSLSEFDITMIGVGAMIGAGIFVLIGIAAGEAGPAVMLALVLNGIVTLFTAMVYAELGSAIPEAGGGYLWVKDALGPRQGFLAGWMSWFSHAVAGALYALGFGSFVVELVRRAGWSLPDAGIVPANKYVAVAVVLAFVGINLRGASETGLAGNIVTIAKISVIGLFVAFGLAAVLGEPAEALDRFEPMFPRGAGAVFVAMGLTFIAFEGYEIIVQAGEEVKQPARAIPRAIFTSLLIVIPIYALVAFTIVGAVDPPGDQSVGQFLGEAGELGLARAADAFMPAGAVIILVGGVLSTISALNATTYSSTRVSFAMGRDRVMPDAFAAVHQRFRTPHVALGATGLLIVFMVLVVPIEDVAAAADVMFLLLFLQVHYAVITIRGEMGDRLVYGYRMPWYPAVPVIGMIANAALAVFLLYFSAIGWLFAVGWIALGLGVYAGYARDRVGDQDRPTVTFEAKHGARGATTVLAPVTDPEHVDTVLRVAVAVARARDARIVALHVIRVPPPLPVDEGRRLTADAEPVVAAVRDFAADVADVVIDTVVAAGRRVSTVIHEVADREDAALVVLGWKGEVHADKARGSVAQEVLRASTIDTLVVKDNGFPVSVGSVVVAVSPGIRQAGTLAVGAELALGSHVPLELVTVVRPGGVEPRAVSSWLDQAAGRVGGDGAAPSEVRTRLCEAEDVTAALVEHVGTESLMVVGASRDWRLRRNLFGQFPDTLASRAAAPVIMVHRAEGAPATLWNLVAARVQRRRPDRPRHARRPGR